jgi:hypothetical protein
LKTAFQLVLITLFVVPELSRAVEIAPATAADIMAALGPDARGLSIRQDDLPDLFTLTSSRIDENSARFLIEQPYLDGRWKDGKAIIEYARDLSYTLVSIYDKAGKRPRWMRMSCLPLVQRSVRVNGNHPKSVKPVSRALPVRKSRLRLRPWLNLRRIPPKRGATCGMRLRANIFMWALKK